MNLIVLCLHVATICGLTLFALRFGKDFLIAWLCLLAVAMNVFVLKQITLFGLSVTSSDALAVGYLLGLNLIQEFFGHKEAKKCMWIALFISCSFVLLSQIHLLYTPNQFDLSHPHFMFLFRPMPRIIIASLASFLVIQLVDITFFGYLRTQTKGKYLTLRACAALIVSHTLDTILFSFLGLYGLVASVGYIICLSLIVKGVVILLAVPFIAYSKKVVQHV